MTEFDSRRPDKISSRESNWEGVGKREFPVLEAHETEGFMLREVLGAPIVDLSL